MTDAAFSLVAHYGVWLLLGATFLSCLAVPVPASVLMLAAGGFIASGDLTLVPTALAAWIGAVIGDQVGYMIGVRGGAFMTRRLSGRRKSGRSDVLRRARQQVDQRGAHAVFLSRWLFSPLGPYVNAIAGAIRMRRTEFTIASMAGEAVWVLSYLGLGYLFTERLAEVATLLSNATGFLAAAAVTVALGVILFRNRSDRHSD